jgi:hypothetical protein
MVEHCGASAIQVFKGGVTAGESDSFAGFATGKVNEVGGEGYRTRCGFPVDICVEENTKNDQVGQVGEGAG